MTTEAFTEVDPYTVSGTGPYAIGHAYKDGAIVAEVELTDGSLVALVAGVDFSVLPLEGPSGDLTLSASAATTYDGDRLLIRRRTPVEQGFAGQTAREKGLEENIDRLAMAVQELEKRAYRALAIESGEVAPFIPQDGRPPIWDLALGRFVNGPDQGDIAGAQAAAAAAAASAAAAATFDPLNFYTRTQADAAFYLRAAADAEFLNEADANALFPRFDDGALPTDWVPDLATALAGLNNTKGMTPFLTKGLIDQELNNADYDWTFVENIYLFGNDGIQSLVSSSVMQDGFEYLIVFNGVSPTSAANVRIQVAFFRETDATWSPWVSFGSAAVANAGQKYGGWIDLAGARFIQNWHSFPRITYVDNDGTFTDTLTDDVPITSIAITHANSQKVSRTRYRFDSGDIDGGDIRMYRRRSGY